MTAMRTAKEARRVLAAAGQAEAPPEHQMRRRAIEVVTEVETTVDAATGASVKVPGRTGLKVVSKIDHLYARQLISERQYLAALEVLRWMEQAQLEPRSALALISDGSPGGGAGGVACWANNRMEALRRLRLLQRDIGVPMMSLLLHVLLAEGNLADWSGLATSTRAKREDYRTGATLALLLIALDRVAEGA